MLTASLLLPTDKNSTTAQCKQIKGIVVLGVDPGTFDSAWVRWDGRNVCGCGIVPNEKLIESVWQQSLTGDLYIENIASYGMAVGKEVFETCKFIGNLEQAYFRATGYKAGVVYRKDVKLHLCHSMKAKDKNISQALKDRFGVVGTKKNPGPLYGVSSHIWSALAVAVYAKDTCLTESTSPRII